MKFQARRFLDSIVSGGLLVASVLALVVFGLMALFSIRMGGSWLPLLFFGVPILTAFGACF
jgi:hypothetical protein